MCPCGFSLCLILLSLWISLHKILLFYGNVFLYSRVPLFTLILLISSYKPQVAQAISEEDFSKTFQDMIEAATCKMKEKCLKKAQAVTTYNPRQNSWNTLQIAIDFLSSPAPSPGTMLDYEEFCLLWQYFNLFKFNDRPVFSINKSTLFLGEGEGKQKIENYPLSL